MIFISYRNEDSAHLVDRLRIELRRQYGARVVFRDKNDLQGGQSWPDELRNKLRECAILLAVIGPGWAGAKYSSSAGRKDGTLRLDDPKDWVRCEIRTALDLLPNEPERKGIPVLVDNATLKDKDWLTDRGLAELADQQGVKLRAEPDYAGDLALLLTRLEQ